jgi:hypothetical protein
MGTVRPWSRAIPPSYSKTKGIFSTSLSFLPSYYTRENGKWKIEKEEPKVVLERGLPCHASPRFSRAVRNLTGRLRKWDALPVIVPILQITWFQGHQDEKKKKKRIFLLSTSPQTLAIHSSIIPLSLEKTFTPSSSIEIPFSTGCPMPNNTSTKKEREKAPFLSSPFTGRKRKRKRRKERGKKHIKNVGATKKVVE